MVKKLITSINTRYSRIYYGYIIVAACFLIMTVAFGSQNTFGVFFKPMSGEFDWSRAATSGPFALYMVFHGLLGVVSGRLSDRFGPRVVVSVGGVILGTGYFLMSYIDQIWQLYLYYGILVAAGCSFMYIPLVAMIARWFPKTRGLMSGIGIAGIGFGIGIIPPITSNLIEKYGWRFPLQAIGIAVAILVILLAQLLKSQPEARCTGDDQKRDKLGELQKGFSFREAFRTSQFWMIFGGWVLYGFIYQIGLVHIVPYATDLGLTAVVASTLLTVIGIIGIFSRIGQGIAGDRFGNRQTVLVSYILMGLGYAGLTVSQTTGMIYAFAVIYGSLYGAGILLIPLVAEYFGYKNLGMISGALIFSNSIGGALGPLLAGGIFDATGSYQWAFALCAAGGVAAGVIIWLVKPVSGLRKE